MHRDVTCRTAGGNFSYPEFLSYPFCVGKRLIFNTCRRYNITSTVLEALSLSPLPSPLCFSTTFSSLI